MPLKVIVIGAGIAGLCAATALRQVGHEVEIFEKSNFATEIGAALAITPNGARVLRHLGFDFVRAHACRVQRWDTLLGDSLKTVASIDLSMAEKLFGASAWAIHRVDLHTELLRLATSDIPGTAKPAILRLGVPVVGADPKEGSVTLQDGSIHHADLIVAADGLHSVLRKAVIGTETKAPSSEGLSAFRFLIDTKTIKDDPKLAATLEAKGPGAAILIDTKEKISERHVMWYPCHDGEVQNFVGVHPTRQEDFAEGETADMRTSMLKEFAHFHPDIVRIISLSSHVKCWPLYVHDPLSTWHNGKIVLIGDAAHPMLPFGGQGSNQAMEDAGALGTLLQSIDSTADPAEISKQLAQFELVRKDRASRVQILSKTRIGREKEVEQDLRRWADPPGSSGFPIWKTITGTRANVKSNGTDVPSTPQERTIHDYSFDVFAKCAQVVKGVA